MSGARMSQMSMPPPLAGSATGSVNETTSVSSMRSGQFRLRCWTSKWALAKGVAKYGWLPKTLKPGKAPIG